MPCNAVAMRRVQVSVESLTKTEVGIKALFAYIAKTLGVEVTSTVEQELKNAQRGSVYIKTELGSFRLDTDGDLTFPASMQYEYEKIASITAGVAALAGKVKQAQVARLIMAIMGDQADVEMVANGTIVMKGVVAL